MAPTKAQTAVQKATREVDEGGGARIFYKGDSAIPQFRVTPAPGGGYFMEEALGAGRFWMPRAYMLTDDAIGADNIPDWAWAEREARGADQARAWEALEKAKLPLTTPLKDYEGSEDTDLRAAARTLNGLQWLLVWPAEAVAEHIGAYQGQWAADAESPAEQTSRAARGRREAAAAAKAEAAAE